MTPVSTPIQRSFSAPAANPQSAVVESDLQEKVQNLSESRFKQDQRTAVAGAQGVVCFPTSGNRSPIARKLFTNHLFFEVESENLIKAKGIPHLVNIREVSCENGQYSIDLDNAGEHDLLDFINENGKLSEENTLLLACQMLECMDQLHKMGVIHRDVKPENVIIRLISDNSESKNLEFTLADLGLSTDKGDQSRCERGTYGYASPELALSLISSPKQDIWCLGYLLCMAQGVDLLKFDPKKEGRLSLLKKMEKLFGKFPKKMVENAPEVIREEFFKRKRCFPKFWKTKYELKKGANFECPNLEEVMKKNKFTDSIKDLLRRVFSYKYRPTARDLLDLDYMKKDICFKMQVPESFKDLILEVQSKVRNSEGTLENVKKEFDLSLKSFNKTFHHFRKSEGDSYTIIFKDKYGTVFHEMEYKLPGKGMLEL